MKRALTLLLIPALLFVSLAGCNENVIPDALSSLEAVESSIEPDEAESSGSSVPDDSDLPGEDENSSEPSEDERSEEESAPDESEPINNESGDTSDGDGQPDIDDTEMLTDEEMEFALYWFCGTYDPDGDEVCEAYYPHWLDVVERMCMVLGIDYYSEDGEDEFWDIVIKVRNKRMKETLEGYVKVQDDDFAYFAYIGEYNGKTYSYRNYDYSYEQLPWVYSMIKYCKIKKEDFVREYKDYLTDEQIEVLFSGDEDAIRDKLHNETTTYCKGRLYNVAELLLTDDAKLKEMNVNGDIQTFIDHLKDLARKGNSIQFDSERRELYFNRSNPSSGFRRSTLYKCANVLQRKISD